MTYPAFIPCPKCNDVAANLTIPFEAVAIRLTHKHPTFSRFEFRTDADKPGPSHHLIVCQHCGWPFRLHETSIVGRPRTIATK